MIASCLEVPTTTEVVAGVETDIPSILPDLFNYILEHGLVKGVFRISGSARRMRPIAANYPSYKEWLHESPNAHDVAGIIKKFLRDYLDESGQLFSPQVLSSMLRLWLSNSRSLSECSLLSYKSASTSLTLSNTLPSISEVEELALGCRGPANVDMFLDSVAQLLAQKNLSTRNLLFLYLLDFLGRVTQNETLTNMTALNLAIIFLPYVFASAELVELLHFQDMLAFFIDQRVELTSRYAIYHNLVGGLHQLDVDCLSVTSSESISASPLTIYSLGQESSLKTSAVLSKRKTLISQRLSILWDSYNLPANRTKRFSLYGLPNSPQNDSEKLVVESGVDSGSTVTPLSDMTENLAVPEARPQLTKRSSSGKRKSIIGILRSMSSLSSKENLNENTGTATDYGVNAEEQVSEAFPEDRNVVRRFSLRRKAQL